jgi:hypothetical protein
MKRLLVLVSALSLLALTGCVTTETPAEETTTPATTETPAVTPAPAATVETPAVVAPTTTETPAETK